MSLGNFPRSPSYSLTLARRGQRASSSNIRVASVIPLSVHIVRYRIAVTRKPPAGERDRRSNMFCTHLQLPLHLSAHLSYPRASSDLSIDAVRVSHRPLQVSTSIAPLGFGIKCGELLPNDFWPWVGLVLRESPSKHPSSASPSIHRFLPKHN